MEVMLRCELPDRPGALALLAGAVSHAGGDIQAVDVVETAGGRALDDLVVVVEPAALQGLVDRLRSTEEIQLVHAGPSRGHPGDAIGRFAISLEALLTGAMTPEGAAIALVGGLLRADGVELASPATAPRQGSKVLLLGFDHRLLVARRAYRFTDTERARAAAIVAVCLAARARVQSASSSG